MCVCWSDPQRAFDFELGGWTVKISRLAEPLSGASQWLEYGVVQIMRAPADRGGSPSVFRTFAVYAVRVRTNDVWRIDSLRIFQMPGKPQ